MELRELEYGVNDGSEISGIHFFAVYGIYDKPARASILNTIASNGCNGCIRCLQTGETLFLNEQKRKCICIHISSIKNLNITWLPLL
jgi:hypothetical protein